MKNDERNDCLDKKESSKYGDSEAVSRSGRWIKAPSGTTLRVYRLLYRSGKPLNLHDIQRVLELSSPSVSQYHVRKLLQAGLIREQENGYVVDRIIFENMIRIRRSVIPVQIGYCVFFATLLVVLFIFLWPSAGISSLFLFALAVNVSALVIFGYQTINSMKRE